MSTKRFTFAATGDSFLSTRISVYREEDFVSLFELIRSQDCAFTNLEILLNDFKGIPAAESGGTYAGAPSSLVEEFKWAGFQLVSRANNHALDYSYEGLRITTEVLNNHGIVHAGVGETLAEARSPAYLETWFGRVALLSACSTFASWGRAGDSRPDSRGRPGLAPIRFSTVCYVDEQHFRNLRELQDTLGYTKALISQASSWGIPVDLDKEAIINGVRFIRSDKCRITTVPHPRDLEETSKWIKHARRQADLVVFTLHAHESNLQKEIPADFILTVAREAIDAGADMVIGHGPHVLRGIEIYKGRPIFYSLGNFVFQNDLVYKHPQEIYDRYGLGYNATPADMYDARSRNDTIGFPADPAYWQSVLAVIHFEDFRPKKVELYPVTLGHKNPRPQRGRPMLARGDEAIAILKNLRSLSAPFGTNIDIGGEVGHILLNA